MRLEWERVGIGPPASESSLSTEILSTLDKSPFHHRPKTNNKCSSRHYYTLQPDSARVPAARCVGWMPMAASHTVSVSEMT